MCTCVYVYVCEFVSVSLCLRVFSTNIKDKKNCLPHELSIISNSNKSTEVSQYQNSRIDLRECQFTFIRIFQTFYRKRKDYVTAEDKYSRWSKWSTLFSGNTRWKLVRCYKESIARYLGVLYVLKPIPGLINTHLLFRKRKTIKWS